MRYIGDYKALCQGGTLEGYLKRNPPAVLLHHSAEMGLGTVTGMPGSTRNRLVLEAHPARRLPGSPAREEAYLVFPLETRTGGAKGKLTVGCSSSCDVFINDASISRKHAVVEVRDGDHYIQDSGSTAGTWINDVRLRQGEWKLLTSGDRLSLGAVNLVFLTPGDFYRFVVNFLGGHQEPQ